MELGFKKYIRTNVAEMTPWHEGLSMRGVSISEPDRIAGSPKKGDMVARNPNNHEDKWLVAKKYFEDNFKEA